jgi:hypothetical protein
MSRVVRALIVASLVAAPAVWAQADYVPDEVIVRFAPGAVNFPDDLPDTSPIDQIDFGDPGFQDVLVGEGVVSFTTLCAEWRNIEDEPQVDLWGDEIELVPFTDVYVLKLSAPADVRELISRLEEFDEVIHAEPNLMFEYAGSASRSLEDCPTPGDPNDQYFPQTETFIGQWGLVNPGIHPDAADDVDVDGDSAWCYQPFASKNVGITDSGTNQDHEDLLANINFRLQMGFDPADPGVDDNHGHGTMVAGVVGAVTQNGIGVAALTHSNGLARRDSIIVTLKTNDEIEPLMNAISYASGTGEIPIITSSLVPCWEVNETHELKNAVRNAFVTGLFMVASTGNRTDQNPEDCANVDQSWCVPCDVIPEVIAAELILPAGYKHFVYGATAILPDGTRPPSYYTGVHIDIAAPGGDFIVTTQDEGGYAGVGGNLFFGGTSASSPLVAGAASLLHTFNADLRNEDVAHILSATATAWGEPEEWGAGLMKVDDALRFIAPPEREIRWASAFGLTSWQFKESREQCFRNVAGLNSCPYVERYKHSTSISTRCESGCRSRATSPAMCRPRTGSGCEVV